MVNEKSVLIFSSRYYAFGDRYKSCVAVLVEI